MLNRLNGWRRLWFAAMVVGVLFAFGYALTHQMQEHLSETPEGVLSTIEDRGSPHFIPGFGSVDFPSDTPSEWIDAQIQSQPPSVVAEEARAMTANQRLSDLAYAKSMASLNKTLNEESHVQNEIALVAFPLFAFVIFALLYGIGATLAWIRRGFQRGPKSI